MDEQGKKTDAVAWKTYVSFALTLKISNYQAIIVALSVILMAKNAALLGVAAWRSKDSNKCLFEWKRLI